MHGLLRSLVLWHSISQMKVKSNTDLTLNTDALRKITCPKLQNWNPGSRKQKNRPEKDQGRVKDLDQHERKDHCPPAHWHVYPPPHVKVQRCCSQKVLWCGGGRLQRQTVQVKVNEQWMGWDRARRKSGAWEMVENRVSQRGLMWGEETLTFS